MITALRLAEHCLEMGDDAAAEEQLTAALERARAGGCVLVELGLLPVLVEAEIGVGRLDAAAQHVAEARAILRHGGNWGGLPAEVDLAEGLLHAASGRWGEAEASLHRAAKVCHG